MIDNPSAMSNSSSSSDLPFDTHSLDITIKLDGGDIAMKISVPNGYTPEQETQFIDKLVDEFDLIKSYHGLPQILASTKVLAEEADVYFTILESLRLLEKTGGLSQFIRNEKTKKDSDTIGSFVDKDLEKALSEGKKNVFNLALFGDELAFLRRVVMLVETFNEKYRFGKPLGVIKPNLFDMNGAEANASHVEHVLEMKASADKETFQQRFLHLKQSNERFSYLVDKMPVLQNLHTSLSVLMQMLIVERLTKSANSRKTESLIDEMKGLYAHLEKDLVKNNIVTLN